MQSLREYHRCDFSENSSKIFKFLLCLLIDSFEIYSLILRPLELRKDFPCYIKCWKMYPYRFTSFLLFHLIFFRLPSPQRLEYRGNFAIFVLVWPQLAFDAHGFLFWVFFLKKKEAVLYCIIRPGLFFMPLCSNFWLRSRTRLPNRANRVENSLFCFDFFIFCVCWFCVTFHNNKYNSAYIVQK